MYKIYMKLLNSIFYLMFSLQDITSQNLHEIVKLYLFPHFQSSRYHFPKFK